MYAVPASYRDAAMLRTAIHSGSSGMFAVTSVQVSPPSLVRCSSPSFVPAHASQMYAKNVITFLDHLIEEGELKFDLEDEITGGAMLTHEGAIVNDRVKALVEGA